MVLLVIKVFQCAWYFVFALLVKNYFEGACVVINFEKCAHRLLLPVNHSANDDDLNDEIYTSTYIVDGLTLNFAHIIRSRLGFLDHFHSHRSKNSIFSSLPAKLIRSLVSVAEHATVSESGSYVLRHEKPSVVAVCKLSSRLR